MTWAEDVDLADYSNTDLPDHVYTAPAAESVVSSDWLSTIKSGAEIIGGAVGTVSGILSAKDMLANARDQRAIDQAQKQADNALAMQKIAADSQVAQLGLRAQIAKATQALNGATGGKGLGFGGALFMAAIAYYIAGHK